MRKVLVVAPHPDDETLGCGGTLLRHKKEGDQIHWLIATEMTAGCGFSAQAIRTRQGEIEKVSRAYPFDSIHTLPFPSTRLDTLPLSDMIQKIGEVLQRLEPDILYLPYREDAHSDHRIVFDAATACTKWFRFPFIKRVLAYETISETDFNLKPQTAFSPNSFVDISSFVGKKLEIMKIYASEVGEFPFPRSERIIKNLAELRGSAAGFHAAEAFWLLKEKI